MKLTNVVCSAHLQCSMDLRALCYRLPNTRYDPARFPGLIWKHKVIQGNCLVFSNGTIQCQGKATGLKEGKQRVRRYARVLQKLGLPVVLRDIKVLTASAFHILSGPLDLNTLIQERSLIYEPELFPTVNMKVQGVTFSCYANGKVIMTGIKTHSDIRQIIDPTLIELELYTT